jgi:hypothetical protein
MQSSTRSIQSAGLPASLRNSPYNRPLTTGTAPEKNSILWKDFSYAIQKRKDLIRKLREAALESSTPIGILKQTLLDVRLTTLTLIEDALEIEYRSRLSGSKQSKRLLKSGRLPPISSFRAMEDKEDVLALADIITDVDPLFTIPNIRVMLPLDFPNTRNPFMLGKDIDELAILVPPHPEPGNAEEELKVLELLRYKRASRALIRAEAQILNRLPLEIHEIERWMDRMQDDLNMEKLLRCVCTLLDNDREDFSQEADLGCLQNPLFNVEAHELMRRLNMFKGVHPMRVDVQVAIRQHLRGCSFGHLDDSVTAFLLEWVELIIQSNVAGPSSSVQSSSQGMDTRNGIGTVALPDSSQKRSLPPSRYGSAGLRMISEASLSAPNSSQGLRISSPSDGKTRSTQSIVGHFPFAPGGFDASSEQKKLSRQSNVNEAENEDLVSIVDEKNGYLQTHEKIFEPEIPKKKLLFRQFDNNVVQTQAADMAVGSDSPTENHKRQVNTQSTGTDADSPIHLTLKKRKIQGQISPMKATDDMPSLQAHGDGFRRKIRSEVEKVMKDLGMFRDNNGTSDGAGGSNVDAISSVRYELNKIQQELLRRQVLDPRHYAVNSVDAIQHAQRGLTVASVNAFDPLDRRGKKEKLEQEASELVAPIALGEKRIMIDTNTGEMELVLSILLNKERKSLFCSVNVSKQSAMTHGVIKETQALTTLQSKDDEVMIELAHFELSKLLFSHLTDATYEELLQMKTPSRVRVLQNVFEQLILFAKQDPIPRGSAIANINRVLFNNKFVEDNVLVDLTISRNVDCNGIVLHCVPIAGLFAKTTSIGPIVINMHDYELEVLLIGQRGLFLQSMSRWKSLEVLAQWIAGRVRIRKVITTVDESAEATNTDAFAATNVVADEKLAATARSTESLTSQLTFTGRKSVLDDIPMTEFDTTLHHNELAKLTGNLQNNLLMLEMTVDRLIDISASFIEHWKSRNVPKITGIEVSLTAKQDLEVMFVTMIVTLPNRRAFKKLLNEKEAPAVTKRGGGGGEGSLIDLDNYSDDDDDDDDHYANQRTSIELSYRLTRAELLTFGSTEPIENKKVSMSKNTSASSDENHPEELLWNVLSRLKIIFKVGCSHCLK